MSAYLGTEQKSENDNLNHKKICMQNNELEISADLKCKAVLSDLTESGEKYFLKNEVDEVELTQKSVSELCLDSPEHTKDSFSIKTVTHKDSHETSPFKQAVRGFVLNKLSKKVGSSTLLSGLSEKLVKKLAEGKENTLSDLVYVNKSEPNISVSGLKESCELHDSLSCELKSVVANDLTEIANVEEAIECFEELKYSLTDSGSESKKSVHKIVTSISVPSSPARFNKTSPPNVGGSLSNIEQYSELQPVVTADSHEILKESLNSIQCTPGFKIEAEPLSAMEQSSNIESCNSSDIQYPLNVHVVNEEEKIPVSHKIADFFSSLQSVFRSLPLSHLLLLTSVIIHNSPFVCSYLALIFDALIIAYICYGYILHKPYLDAFQHISTPHPQLESATIHVDEEVKEVK
ncbi:uncharacterized protein LOC118182494, partial [Stegodyphus dumicola]|uniref:uncharacterized protein LOC118182494 n=1 Tax=Stegodyphus dumicola TaxID=202533 RepID=UPI0015AA00C3